MQKFPEGLKGLGLIERLSPEEITALLVAKNAEIERLRTAVWDYGEHTIKCTVRDGKECDCGFFELLKTVPAPRINQQLEKTK